MRIALPLAALGGLVVLAAATVQADNPQGDAPEARPPARRTAKAIRPTPPATTLAAIRARGTLRICAVARAPWFKLADEGDPDGYLAAVGRLLAGDLDVPVEFVKGSPASLLASLSEGACDLAAGLSPTPEGATKAHFSTPLVEHSVEIVASRKSADDFEERKDFDRPEVTFGALAGFPDASDVRRAFPRAKVRNFATSRDLEAAVAAGTVHAMLATKPLARRLIHASKGRFFRPFDKSLGHRREGLAVRVGDVELLAYLDTWIQAHADDHVLEELQDRWLDVGDHRGDDDDND